jgi:hypothetical protein
MQIKTTVRFISLQSDWQSSRKQATTNAAEDAGGKGLPFTAGGNVN